MWKRLIESTKVANPEKIPDRIRIVISGRKSAHFGNAQTLVVHYDIKSQTIGYFLMDYMENEENGRYRWVILDKIKTVDINLPVEELKALIDSIPFIEWIESRDSYDYFCEYYLNGTKCHKFYSIGGIGIGGTGVGDQVPEGFKQIFEILGRPYKGLAVPSTTDLLKGWY